MVIMSNVVYMEVMIDQILFYLCDEPSFIIIYVPVWGLIS